MSKKIPRHKAYKSCEYAFIEEGYTCKAIADIFGVSEKTLGGWRTGQEWDRRREENLSAPHKIREILQKEIRSIAEGNPARIDADSLAKVSKVFFSLEDKMSVPVVISVLKMLDNWTADIEPHKAVENTELHKRFLLHLIQTTV